MKRTCKADPDARSPALHGPRRSPRIRGWLGVGASSLVLIAGGAMADDASIDRHRKGTLRVLAKPGAVVEVEQLRHEFWFGATLPNGAFDGRQPPEVVDRYKAVFLEYFNAAVTEVALKWHAMEPQRGKVNYAVVDAMLDWTARHNLPLRGHNIYWGIRQFIPKWQLELDDTALRQVLEQRGRDIGRRYRGRFAEYDLNNEMIHGNVYAERLGEGITADMARWVREEDPKARLYLNDYDITTGKKLDAYVAHIRDLLQRGVPVAGIGVQGHLHGDTFDRAELRRSLETLAQFKLPVRITEFNIPGQRSKYQKDRTARLTPQEEEQKARELVDFYRICFAQPAVEGILMWGFWEGANWIPASSLFARDWTPLPAAKAYKDLVYGTWWTRARGTADAQGRFETRAFFGAHRVRVDGRAHEVRVEKARGGGDLDVR